MGISTSTIKSRSKIYNNPLIKKSIFVLLQKSATKILLVEGDGDVPFYSQYINASVNLSEVTKTKDYKLPDSTLVYTDGQKTAKKYVQFLVNEHQKRMKVNSAIHYGSCYGIVDKDFDGLNTSRYRDMGKNIICTDQRDLETTLIHFDRQNIEQGFERDFIANGGSFNIIEKSIDAAFQIGKVRFLREAIKNKPNNFKTKEIKINFKDIELLEDNKTKQNGYYKFIRNGIFEISDFLKFSNENNIRNIEDDIKTLQGDSLSYCRGHDIFDFVACFYKIANPNLSWKGLTKITALIDKYETQLKEDFFDDTNFKAQSQIYRFLQVNSLT